MADFPALSTDPGDPDVWGQEFFDALLTHYRARVLPSHAPEDSAGIYQEEACLYNVTADNTRRSRAALGRAGRSDDGGVTYGVFNQLILGDSIAGGCVGLGAGPGGSDAFDRTHAVGNFLEQEIVALTDIPIAGTGFMRIHDGERWDDRFTLNSTATDANTAAGASVFLPTGATVTYDTEFDDADIFRLTYYDNFAGATGFSLSVDGASSGDGFGQPSGAGPGQWRTLELTLASPVPAGTSVVATGIASGNTMVVGHLEVAKSTGGISTHKLAASGSGAYTWADIAGGGGFNLLRTVNDTGQDNPFDLVHIPFGLFDAENSNAVDFKTNMGVIHDYFPDAEFVLHAMPIPGNYAATPETWLPFLTAYYELADEWDCRLVDVQALSGGYDAFSALDLNADTVAHFKQPLSKMWGRATAKALA